MPPNCSMSKIIQPSNEFLFITNIDKSPNNLMRLFTVMQQGLNRLDLR